jgi:hypothetical protein
LFKNGRHGILSCVDAHSMMPKNQCPASYKFKSPRAKL